MPKPHATQAIAFALNWLETTLSAEMSYHNLAHTKEIVMPAADRFARDSGVSEDDRGLVAVAAAFHDIGITVRRDGHEITAMRMTSQLLPGFGFDNAQIDIINGMILATRLPQSPRTPLEEIMADADLDVLGRDDFFETNEALRQELAAHGEVISSVAWNQIQLQFLQGHRYFTDAARTLRQPAKEAHIITLRALIEAA